MNKKLHPQGMLEPFRARYILERDGEFVCEDVTLETATQICTHFNARYDTFKIENADGDCWYFDRDRKEFFKRYEEQA